MKFIEVTVYGGGIPTKRLINTDTVFSINEHPKQVLGRCLISFVFAPDQGIEIGPSYDEVKKQLFNSSISVSRESSFLSNGS